MKYFFSLILIVTAPLLPTAAQIQKNQHQENFLFLSSDQFEHLTVGEQKSYIETLRHLILQFEIQKDLSPRVSAMLKNHSWLLQSLLAPAHAQVSDVWTPSTSRSNDITIENAKISYALIFLDSRITAAQDLKSELMRTDSRENFMTIYDRLKTLSQKNLNPEQRKNFNANLAGLREKYGRLLSIAPDLAKMHAEITQFTAASAPLLKSLPASAPATRASTTTTAFPVRPPQSQKKLKAADTAHCLYSGFVLRDTRCTPLQTLPSELRLTELGAADFKCKSPHEILCNPLVFGYQSDLSPYCTVRSKTASKNCQEISNNSENLARLHKAWQNPANKKVFDDFQNSLKSLCDSENKSADVRSTCKVVVAQFNEKVKKEFPAQLAAASSASKADKASKAN